MPSAPAAAGQCGTVNVRITDGTQLVQYWDGTDTTGATAGPQGGPGTWNSTNTNWTDDPVAGTVKTSAGLGRSVLA